MNTIKRQDQIEAVYKLYDKGYTIEDLKTFFKLTKKEIEIMLKEGKQN